MKKPLVIGGVPWDFKMSRGLSYVLPDGTTVGLFYDSYTRLQHMAVYVPCRELPRVRLCGLDYGNFSLTGEADRLCPECMARFREMASRA